MNNFDEVTINLRKAFRLLLNFVKTFNGIIQYINKSFELTSIGNRQIWGNPPQNKAKYTYDKDFWDWFPIYFYSYNFKKDKPKISFSVILQCDTGYLDYYTNKQNFDNWENDEIYNELDKYINVNEAKTRILFGLCEGEKYQIAEVFKEASANTKDFEKYNKFFTKNGEDKFQIPVSERNKKYIYFKVFELADFKDETTTRQSLENFIKYLDDEKEIDKEIIKALQEALKKTKSDQ